MLKFNLSFSAVGTSVTSTVKVVSDDVILNLPEVVPLIYSLTIAHFQSSFSTP